MDVGSSFTLRSVYLGHVFLFFGSDVLESYEGHEYLMEFECQICLQTQVKEFDVFYFDCDMLILGLLCGGKVTYIGVNCGMTFWLLWKVTSRIMLVLDGMHYKLSSIASIMSSKA